MNKTQCTLAFAAIFLLGAIAGVAGGLAFARHRLLRSPDPATITAHLQRRMQKDLNFTPAQAEQIYPVLQRTGVRLQSLHQKVFEMVAKTFAETDAEIVTQLTPEQRMKFEESQRRHHREYLPGDGRTPGG